MIKIKKVMSIFKQKSDGENNMRTIRPLPEESQGGKNKEEAGWVSPVYNQSRRVHLNPNLIAGNRCLAFWDGIPEAEAYRILRTKIIHQTSSPKIIMVTSALPEEGKTITAVNLAFSFAREFQHTVLLVDGDLKNQSIKKCLGCDNEKGLMNHLQDDCPMSDIIMWPEIEKITFISGGKPCHESAEILASPRMKQLVSEMRNRYPERYIIFDTPPVLTGADALTLSALADHIVFVVKTGKTQIDDIRKALQYLPKEKIIGFVLNECESTML